ncbi:helix-turn-helix domain-containing protein [Puia sp. P3]|uniref:helix-turn-helix domain-containing protein n=1 Tax=Puia sp. P3 TaxID=3423952 RepID=UPI003D67E8FC
MTARTEYTLINPTTRALAFSIFTFEDGSVFEKMKSYGYYSMVLVREGEGIFQSDISEFEFSGNSLICFSLYQSFRLQPRGEIKGLLIHFHPDFFCIHKHQEEVACNGVLFNNPYESPLVALDKESMSSLLMLVRSLEAEMQNAAVAQYELLVSYLKIFLIQASRIKLQLGGAAAVPQIGREPFILKTLKDAIEEHFRTKHSAGEYASLLNITTKALNKLSKAHFKKTLTGLIAERIMVEAKRELYLTAKSVKLIAYELGFNDEFYFSRFFKNQASVSPQIYRETVGFGKGG